MRPVLIVLAGVCASVGSSLAVWVGMQSQAAIYCEVLEGGLVSTNASEQAINLAVADLMSDTRSPSAHPEQELQSSAYHESAQAWFSKKDFFGLAEERANRLVRDQRGRDGLPMQIEVLSGADMPTLIFIRHESEETITSLGLRLSNYLAQYGVPAR